MGGTSQIGDMDATSWTRQMLMAILGMNPAGAYGQPTAQAIFGGLNLAGPGLFGGQGTASGQASSMMLPALMANIFASPGSPFAGGATANLVGRSMMGLSAAGAFGNVQGAGGMLPGGFGLGPGVMPGITGMMEGMTGQGPRDLGMGDVARITQTAGQGGFFNQVTQVRQVREKLRDMVKTVKSLSDELTMTIDEVGSGMNAMRGMGFTTAGTASAALRQVMRASAASGIAPSEMMAYSAAEGQTLRAVAHIPLSMGTAAARNTLGFIGAGVRTGMIGEEALQNAYGAGGQEGAVTMANRMQELGLRMMSRAPMQFSLAAMMDPKTGTLSQERMGQLLTGQMTPSDIQQQANQYVGSLGPGGYAKWLGQMPEMRSQFMAAGGAMAPIALGGMMMQQHGYGMDPTDPRNLGAFSRVMSRMTGTQVDPMEARAMMEMYQNMGNISEASTIATRNEERQEQRTRAIADSFARRDPAYQLRRVTRDVREQAEGAIERAATSLAARAERAMAGASGAGFDVVTSAALYSGGAGVSSLLSSGGVRSDKGGPMDFFRTGTGREVEGREEISRILREGGTRDDPLGFLNRAASMGRSVRVLESEHQFFTKRFMGGGTGAAQESSRAIIAMSRGEAEREFRRRGADTSLIGNLRETSDVRESMISAYGMMDDAAREKVSKALNSEGVLDASGLVESFARMSPKEAEEATALLFGGTAGSKVVTELSKRTVRAARMAEKAAKKTGLGLGAVEYAAGTTAGQRYEQDPVKALQTAAAVAFGDNADRAISFVSMNPEQAGSLFSAIQSGKDFSGKTTLGGYLQAAGVDVSGLDKTTLGMKVSSPDDLLKFMSAQGGVMNKELAEDLRQVGWLSDTQGARYREGAGKLTGGARAFAEAMSGATGMLKEGKGREGFEAAASALVGLVSGDKYAFNQAQRAGLLKDPAEAERFRRDILSGGGISLEETKKWLGTESFKDLAAITQISEERLEKMSLSDPKGYTEEERQKFAQAIARQALTPGAGGSTSGGGQMGALAAQFGAILGQYGESGALRVIVTNQPGGSNDAAEPPVSGTQTSASRSGFPGT